jgi:hypothetical protein
MFAVASGQTGALTVASTSISRAGFPGRQCLQNGFPVAYPKVWPAVRAIVHDLPSVHDARELS